MSSKHPYLGMSASIATKHGKEKVMSPIFHRWLGMQLYRCISVDTDQFGTFTGEIPRIDTMLETARKKAREAVRQSGCAIGLGSEGSFGPDPYMPFLASGAEAILLYDSLMDHEIYVQRRTRTNFDHIIIRPDEDPSTFLQRVGFPNHAIIIKPERTDEPYDMIKGLTDPKSLHDNIRSMARRSRTGRALIQTDMRAHLNPTRMSAIGIVTKHLVLRIMRLCPGCGLPGYGQSDVERGIPCAACGIPTSLTKADVYSCRRCGFSELRHIRSESLRADPRYCVCCNP